MGADRGTSWILAAALAAGAAGCALKPPPSRDDLRQDALAHTDIPAAWRAPGGVAQSVTGDWLASFNDPTLTALVAEAIAYNADLRAAATLVEQASAYLQVASAPLLPSVRVISTESA